MTESRKPPLSRLQELIRTRLAALGERGKPMSHREAARRSRGAFSNETLSAILRGNHGGGITDRIAQGLAAALEVPVSEVYEAANTPMPETRWRLPERFDRLTPAQRKVVEDVAAALLEAYDKGRRDQA
jgi:hypothetical protein